MDNSYNSPPSYSPQPKSPSPTFTLKFLMLLLKKYLSSFCKVVSKIRPIPLGLKQKSLCHIMSFRRSVQVIFAPNITPPDHINLTFSGANYRVFLTTESVRCFNCGEFGHVSRSCKKGNPMKLYKMPMKQLPILETHPALPKSLPTTNPA